jgi:hypothetical protein
MTTNDRGPVFAVVTRVSSSRQPHDGGVNPVPLRLRLAARSAINETVLGGAHYLAGR